MNEIIGNRHTCYLCGRNGACDPLDKHHVFGGTSCKKQSEADGLCVMLCHFNCHIFGPDSVHNNGALNQALKREVQEIAMERYGWTEDEFRARYGRSYL